MRLGRIFGIEVRLDHSWWIVFALMTWSLAGHLFPMGYPGWPRALLWTIGLLTSVLFFASVLAHELGHSLVSQRTGIPVRRITLLVFGGIAEMTAEPRRPLDELRMALAGPAVSLALSIGFPAFSRLPARAARPHHPATG
jgi:Zn-dependent protease